MPSSEIEILGYRLRVIAPAQVLEPLRNRLATPTGLIDAGDAGYSATIRVTEARPGHYRIERDGAHTVVVPSSSAVGYLEWLIHAVAIGRLRRCYLMLHAGAVALGGAGFVLCAASGSGKSTLTAALVASGCAYLSDEVAAIDPLTLQMHPYPRNLCVKAGSLTALAPYYPELAGAAPETRGDGEAVWYLRPPDERWQRDPVPVRQIVFPRYEPGAATVLAPLSRGLALERLAAQSFTGSALGARTTGTLARLVMDAGCFELVVGSLPEGVAAVRSLAGG